MNVEIVNESVKIKYVPDAELLNSVMPLVPRWLRHSTSDLR